MSRATYLGADLGISWIAEFGIDGWRAVIGPSSNGRPPFILTVHDPKNAERMRSSFLRTAGAALEGALSFLANYGITPDNRDELAEIAERLDAAPAAVSP
jgi:hypothetical protein